MDKLSSNLKKNSLHLMNEILIKNLNNHAEDVRKIIMEEYDTKLTSVVSDRRSKTNPGLPIYVDAFRTAVYEFPMVNGGDEIRMSVPDMSNFKFDNGPLRVIKTILEGVVGKFVEVTLNQYLEMYKQPSSSLMQLDSGANVKDVVYILRYNADVQNRERITFGKRGALVVYPFSNLPPIDVFDKSNKYVEENMDRWIDESIEEFNKELQKMYN